MLGEVLAPRGQGLDELLLALIRLPQQIAGWRHVLRTAVPLVGQELRQLGDGVFVAAAMDVALGDLQMCPAGADVLRESFEECLQRGHAEFQLLVGLRLRDLPSVGQAETRLRDAVGFRVAVFGQQVLPHAPRLGGPIGRQQALAPVVPRVDRFRRIGVVASQLLVPLDRLVRFLLFLVTAADLQFDRGAAVRSRADVQGLFVELPGLGVVRLPVALGRIEQRRGQIHVDFG